MTVAGVKKILFLILFGVILMLILTEIFMFCPENIFFAHPFSSFAYQKESEKQDLEQKHKVARDFPEDECLSCLNQGKDLFWQQKYSEAIDHLKQCLLYDPENPEIYYYIGQSYFQLGQLSAQNRNIIKATRYYREAYQVSDKAIEKYLKLISQNPEIDHTDNYLKLAYIYQIRSLIPNVNEYEKAIDIYIKLLAEKPYLTFVYYHLGWIYYQLEDYENAIDSFLKYLNSKVKSDFVYYYLGLSYDKIGESQKARYYFQLILEEFPESALAKNAKKELD